MCSLFPPRRFRVLLVVLLLRWLIAEIVRLLQRWAHADIAGRQEGQPGAAAGAAQGQQGLCLSFCNLCCTVVDCFLVIAMVCCRLYELRGCR